MLGFAVVALAWLRFSENTADNDLWGHVLYGQRALLLGGPERTEVLSWTAAGLPWINHEVWAEVGFGFVHRLAGGPGLWLAMLGLAALTVIPAWRAGGGRDPAQRLTALGLLAISINSIALGYAVRPQLFTMLLLVLVLLALRAFFSGRVHWGWAVPVAFAAWANLHGGYFAGWVVLLGALGAEALMRLWPGAGKPFGLTAAGGPSRAHLATVAVLASGALLLNPWGSDLVRWTWQTLLLPRPQIAEWHAPGLSGAALGVYLLVLVSLYGWLGSRRPRRAWEAVTLALLAGMAVLQLRHAPLFALANLIFTPPHLCDALQRLARPTESLRHLLSRRLVALPLAGALLAAGVIALGASLTPRTAPFTMEVPKDTYPVTAVAFMRDHGLAGRTLTFFDWGQMVLWELPHNPVSFDGRLDTVYPDAIRDAHWRFYAGEDPGPGLDPAAASVALLPTAYGAVDWLRRAGWTLVYRDPLASVLVRTPADHPALATLRLPVQLGPAAVSGRVRFPDRPPLLATELRPR
ncbi:MAG: hypothetical protein BroJett029_42000 [Alphaproteobacteria bacterium]|nr:MAG: hypothetical protein BroJett029_42000 [Alphaproteobacteria bacterium]